MQAVVRISGKQYIVEPGAHINVAFNDTEPGSKLELDDILLFNDGKTTEISPKNHIVQAVVVEHGLGEKIRVFKHHAKKRYRRTQGHRQAFTHLHIVGIEARAKKATTKEA